MEFNFIEMEKKWLSYWKDHGIIDQYLHKNDNAKERFSFLDGPITANNPMGVHHAWGRTYKDLWQKFNNLLGKKQRFQNGFDCQGLWVEVEVEKELATKTKKDIENLVPGDKKASIAKFVQLCKDRVMKFSGIQSEQSKRLAYFMDWDHSYFTMSDENNYMIWVFLKKCFENGWIYKGRDSVPWCPRCETAISQHEMLTEDYKELTHETVFFKLPIVTKGWEKIYLLAWTTTPWTVPANVAIAVNGSYTYGIWKDEQSDEKYVFLYTGEEGKSPTRQLKNRELSLEAWVMDKSGKTLTFEKAVKAEDLVGLTYTAPFDNLPIAQAAYKENEKTFHTVVDGKDIVTSGEGTGLLHVAPGAGQEDFKLGKEYKLPIIAPIKDNADYMDGMNEFSGKNAKKHPELIIDHLKQLEGGRYLLKTLQYTHRYPACWRCKTELVWKVADEWYIAMDRGTKDDKRTLRERMMEVAKKITWMPEFGLDRELDWLKNMHDWLISKKNRYWGLSLPIYECKKCATFEVLGSKEELKKRAVKGWAEFEGHSPHKPFIDEVVIACSKCGGEIHRIEDVGNPWLDAGIVPYSTITEQNQGEPLYTKNKNEWSKWFPVDFITESFPGQFKNWFYAMIAESTVLEDTNPFQRVLGFATQLGEDGRPMHKSWGNSIEFNEGADKIGVDVMRWMFVRHNPADNMLFGYKKADEVRRQFYLMLWNVYKYYMEYSKLDSFDYKKADATKTTNILDIWLLSKLTHLSAAVKTHMQNYTAKEAAMEIEGFVADVSTWYIRRSRNRVWNNSDDKADKQSFYTTLYTVLENLSIIISPFLPFISEEIYTNLTGQTSVHLSTWPTFAYDKTMSHTVGDMALVREIVEVGNRLRKELKLKVRQPLASITITAPASKKFAHTEFMPKYYHLIADELNVKEVLWAEQGEEISVAYDTTITPALKAEGEIRELVRKIQYERKVQNLKQNDMIHLVLPRDAEPYKDAVKKLVSAREVTIGEELRITKS